MVKNERGTFDVTKLPDVIVLVSTFRCDNHIGQVEVLIQLIDLHAVQMTIAGNALNIQEARADDIAFQPLVLDYILGPQTRTKLLRQR